LKPTIILVTGVSAGEDREPDRAFLAARYPRHHMELFDPYLHGMQTSKTHRVMGLFDWTNRAHDVLAYRFTAQAEVDRHYNRMIESKRPVLIIGHSLGTVIIARNLPQSFDFPPVLFFNSPLWIPGYSQQMGIRQPCSWPTVANFYSSRDPIALRPLNGKKFRVGKQLNTRTGHDFRETWNAAVRLNPLVVS
jgi:alpha-beta hydrolase superfamily lysophospholipase